MESIEETPKAPDQVLRLESIKNESISPMPKNEEPKIEASKDEGISNFTVQWKGPTQRPPEEQKNVVAPVDPELYQDSAVLEAKIDPHF